MGPSGEHLFKIFARLCRDGRILAGRCKDPAACAEKKLPVRHQAEIMQQVPAVIGWRSGSAWRAVWRAACAR